MSTCHCNQYGDILNYDLLKKRYRETKNILANLLVIAEHPEKEHFLYKCANCGQQWQRSLSWMDGNKPYAFKVPPIEIEVWKQRPFVQPDDLFAITGGIDLYLERATFEEQSTLCKNSTCSHHAIKFSVFCIVHHMENLGIRVSIPDNYTWFPPFEKGHIELTYQRLSELPNYKKLS